MSTFSQYPDGFAAGHGPNRAKRQPSSNSLVSREPARYAPTASGARHHPRPQGQQMKHDAGTARAADHPSHLDHHHEHHDHDYHGNHGDLKYIDDEPDFSSSDPTAPPQLSPRWDSLPRSPLPAAHDHSVGLPRNPGSTRSGAASPTSSTGQNITGPFPYSPDTPPPTTRAFPLRTRHLEDDQQHSLASSSPISSHSPVTIDSRPSTATDANMVVENFSRPRKPSVRYHPQDAPIILPPYKSSAGPEEDHAHSAQQPPLTASSQLSVWPRARGLSTSSSRSTSTYSSFHRPSNDQLNGSYRIGSLRQGNSTLAATSAPHVRPSLAPYHSHQQNREAPWLSEEESRSSFRSQLTASTAHGTLFTQSETERNSILTKATSINSYNRLSTRTNSFADGGLSVDDVMGMYANGFESDMEDGGATDAAAHADNDDDTREWNFGVPFAGNVPSRPPSSHSTLSHVGAKMLEAMNDPLPTPGALAIPVAGRKTGTDAALHRRSLLPSSLPKEIEFGKAMDKAIGRPRELHLEEKTKHDSAKLVNGEDLIVDQQRSEAVRARTPSPETPPPVSPAAPPPAATTLPREPPEEPGSRDRYGFRKANAYITRQQYDTWDETYTEYLARRRKKWVAFLKDSSLMTDNPNRFPPRNAKTKRFIRKGIPPDWRGAAWFYYASGPAILAKHPGMYDELVRRAGLESHGDGRIPGVKTEVKPLVVEDIEKDLHRTFPDNIRFRPPMGPVPQTQGKPDDSQETLAENPSAEPEVISSLRRVLHAFSLYNPRIGYCQSLNFLAGMLLLFVETEEQAFWLLNVITRVYLPGTHEMSLEGSKVDLGVLMVALKDSMPGVWKHLAGDEADMDQPVAKKTKKRDKDNKQLGGGANDPNRLPAITLCMTAWFMSCFIGTLPIEPVLRVWDIFFYEGSRTLFRIALAIFKVGEAEIKAVADPMEMFGVVQTIPRRLLDPNALLEACYKRRNGIGHLSQDMVEEKRQERRDGIRRWKAEQDSANDAEMGGASNPGEAGLDLAAPQAFDFDEFRRKGTLFGKRKDREQVRAAEVM